MLLKYTNSKAANKALALKARESYVISYGKGSDIVLGADEGVKATLYQEGEQWVVMCIEGEIRVDGERCASAELQHGQTMEVGDVVINVFDQALERVDKVVQGTSENGSKSRYFLIGAFLLAIGFVVFVNTQNTQNTPRVSQDSSPDAANVETAKNESDAMQVKILLDDKEDNKSIYSNEEERVADSRYRQAVRFYELGRIKDAMEVLQQGLRFNPNSQLLQAKLIDWGTKLDNEITRYYQQGCVHAKYLRYHEAVQMFRVVTELSLNTLDLRYADAKRIIGKIGAGISTHVRCGESSNG